jgi:hypothetical protein
MFLPTLSNHPIGRYHSAAPAKSAKEDRPRRYNQRWLVVIKNSQNTQFRLHYGKYVLNQSK